jgi:hypothetical protein
MGVPLCWLRKLMSPRGAAVDDLHDDRAKRHRQD